MKGKFWRKEIILAGWSLVSRAGGRVVARAVGKGNKPHWLVLATGRSGMEDNGGTGLMLTHAGPRR